MDNASIPSAPAKPERPPTEAWRVGDAGHTVFGPKNPDGAPRVIASGLSRVEARLIASSPVLLHSLKGLARIVEAFSYTTQLGDSQRRRLVEAKSLIAEIGGAA